MIDGLFSSLLQFEETVLISIIDIEFLCGFYLAEFKPSMWIKSSALNLLEASCSPSEPRKEHKESTSSMNIVEGECSFAISNSSLTSFSDSPRYLDVMVDDETLKNVVPHSVATAFANIVFPVPGGPTISTPFHGLRMP